MLNPTVVHDGFTRRVAEVSHRAEIQSLAMHDPAAFESASESAFDAADGNAVPVRLASVDAAGRGLVTTLPRGGWTAEGPPTQVAASQYALEPSPHTAVSGWAGVCFDHAAPSSVAVARHFAKTVDVYDGDRRVRTMHTLLNPYSVSYVPPTGGIPGFKGDGSGPLIAVAEGNTLSLWDVRQAERGGCARRMTLCNRGQPLYAVAVGTSQGAAGGGGLKVAKLTGGEPLIASAGAERGVHVLDADRWSVVKRWPAAIKFEITMMALSSASPDHVYLAGMDYEVICGCWSRGSIAGGFAFRGDSRWLGMARAEGKAGGGGAGKDILAGWCESGNLFAARVERVPGGRSNCGENENENDRPEKKLTE